MNDLDYKDYRVIIVDDESGNLESFELCYKKTFNVITCDNATTALEKVKAYDNVACVVSDQRMPDISGIELLAKVKEINPSIQRFIITGYSDISVCIEGINNGLINKYFQKPYDVENLESEIKGAIYTYLKKIENEKLTTLLMEKVSQLVKLKNQGSDEDVNTLINSLVSEVSAFEEFSKIDQLEENNINNKEDINTQNAKASFFSEEVMDLIRTKEDKSYVKILILNPSNYKEIVNFCDMHHETLSNYSLVFEIISSDENIIQASKKCFHECQSKYNLNITVKTKLQQLKDVLNSGLNDLFDIIYVPYLYNHFSTPVAKFITNQLLLGLFVNGKLVFSNYSHACSNTADPQRVVVRTEADINDLLEIADEAPKIIVDNSSNIIFASIKK
ncbi:MAG: response regulator [Pseudomonadota bacterium]